MYHIHFLTDPTPEQKHQLLTLYHDQGWWPRHRNDPETVSRVIKGSHCFLVVETCEGIIGMGRALSDATGDAYIHDVLVRADHRGQSLGKRIVTTLVKRLKQDGITWLGLIAEKNSHGFYEKLGFDPMQESAPMFMFDTSK